MVTPATDYPDREFVIAKLSGSLIAREALERKSGARGLLAHGKHHGGPDVRGPSPPNIKEVLISEEVVTQKGWSTRRPRKPPNEEIRIHENALTIKKEITATPHPTGLFRCCRCAVSR